MDNYHAIINSPLGKLGICTSDNALTHLRYLDNSSALLSAQNDYAQVVIDELEEYFANPQHRFRLSLALQVSAHSEAVLNALCAIPSGTTLSYGQLAANIGSGARAVGNACRHNPIAIVIPCHRIVATTHLGGYNGSRSGTMLDIKQWLLAHEARSLA